MDPDIKRRQRIGAFLAALERLSLDDLTRLALPPGDRPERVAARDRALAAAEEAALRSLVEDAAHDARELAIRAFASHQYQPTWVGLQWGRSLGSARDRANLIAAVEDAALATVVADVADAEDVALLAEPYQTLASMRATYPEQALARATSTAFGPAVGVLVAMVAVTGFVAIGIGSPLVAGLIVVTVLVAQAIRRRRST